MNEFETYMMQNGINQNLQKKMNTESKPKQQKQECQPELEKQAYILKGFRMVQALRNWIALTLKRKQDPLLQ
jgi:hypothetical protein